MFSRVFALTNLLRISQRQSPNLISGARTLFTPATLGMESFFKSRESMIQQTQGSAEQFKKKMQDFSDPNSPNLVFTEDLKLMVYIAENNKDDLLLLHNMIVKFQNQNKDLRFGTFSFGPIVMRFYSMFDLPREALKIFKDPATDGFFDQVTTYVVLADLLFRHEMYDEVLEVYEIIKNKQIQNLRFPKNLMLVVFAVYYRMNTPESLQKSLTLLKELQEAGHLPIRRILCYVSVLAIRHGQPHVALEIISGLGRQEYITVRNIKALALSEVGRPDDAVPILRSPLNREVGFQSMHQGVFFQEVIDKVEEAVAKLDKQEVTLEFNRIKLLLEEQNMIMKEGFDHMLLKEVDNPLRSQQQQPNNQYLNASYSTRDPRRPFNQTQRYGERGGYQGQREGYQGQRQGQGFRRDFQQRPGLKDLV